MKRQSGFLSIAAVAMIIIFGILMAAVVRLFMSGSESSVHTQAGNRSYNLANAGVEVGLYNLKSTSTCNISVTSVTLTTGVYTYTCATYSPSTTLSGNITAASTSITLTDASSFAPLGAITIGSETIYYNAKSGNTLSNVRRGQGGTTAAAASMGAGVSQNEYVITGVGYVPNQTAPTGQTTLQQAVILQNGGYFSAGANHFFFQYTTNWSSLGQVGTAGDVEAMSCPSTTKCYAAGDQGWFYSWSGGSWSTMNRVGTSNIYGMACPSTNLCWAAGAGGRFYSSTNGGAWVLVSVFSGTFRDMACASFTRCFAVADGGVIYSWTGGSWSLHTDVGSTNLGAIACPSSTTCLAAGDSGRFYKWTGGGFWVADTTIGSNRVITMACPSANNCQAGGAAGKFYKWNGSNWSASSDIGGDHIDGMACSSSTSCRAGGQNSEYYVWDSGSNTWSFDQQVPGNQDVLTIASAAAGSSLFNLITRN